MTIRAPAPRNAILIGLTAAGLFIAGFGFGYESPPDDDGFDDPGHPVLRAAFHGNFSTRLGRDCDE
jgi:hypothetical protein